MTSKQTYLILLLIFTFLTVGIIGQYEVIKAPYNKVVEMQKKSNIRVIHPALRPYVNEYIVTMAISGIEIPDPEIIIIDLVDIYEGVSFAGLAEGMNKDLVYVRINRAIWNRLSKDKRRLLIFHELSHDIYNLQHGEIELMLPAMDMIKSDFNTLKQELINYLK